MSTLRVLLRHAGAVVLSLALAVGLGACGSSSTQPDPMSQEDSDDIAAQIAATSSASDFGSFVLGGGIEDMSVVSHLPSPSAVAFQPTSWDTTFTRDSLTLAFQLGFFTIGGAEDDHYAPLTTWKVTEDSDIHGTITLAHYHAGYGHVGHLDFYGMRATDDTLSFGGSAHDTAFAAFTSPFRPVTRYCHLDVTRTISDVTIVRSLGPYPQSGFVQWVAVATYLRSAARGDVEVVVHATVMLTFTGTRYCVLTVANGQRYSFDLQTGAIARFQA